jgi:hypothetical protein
MEHLGPVAGEWEDFEPATLRLVRKYCYDLPANWKIMMDAF